MSQITDTILMIRPVAFRMNEETAVNNYFQEQFDGDANAVNKQAQAEFDAFVAKLRNAGVTVLVADDLLENNTPDSIFPNNWVSFHADGTVGLYPMFAENRRRERREDVLEQVEDAGYHIEQVVDYTSAEEEDFFLEGTGSLLLDREHKKAYCALSPRADESLFIEFCEDFEYDPVVFNAFQTVNGERLQIYHTNVMMALAEDFAVVCLDSIDDKKERKHLVQQIKSSGKEILNISEGQMHQFAGNMLQVRNSKGDRFMVMSGAAFRSLKPDQIALIERSSKIIHSDLEVIETCGGGSARCMMAEIFLPKTVQLEIT